MALAGSAPQRWRYALRWHKKRLRGGGARTLRALSAVDTGRQVNSYCLVSSDGVRGAGFIY